jgi:hypothetical protein
VSLHEAKHQLVYVFSAYIPLPFISANIRTLPKVIQVVTTQSVINLDGTYVVLVTLNIDGLSLTPTKTGRLLDVIPKFELLHFGYVAQWENFRRAVTTNQLLCLEDIMSLPVPYLPSVLNSRQWSCVDASSERPY